MKSIDNICVVIQARLSSERVPQKMIKPFAGTTITDIAVKTVLESKVIPRDNFYLSLYEEELKDIANKHGANIFHRSKESAFSEGTPLTLMYEWWNKLPYDYCVLVNACAPFLTTETIDSFVEAYKNTDSDGLFAVMEKRNYFWNLDGEMTTKWPKGQACMNTKAVEKTYEAAHCLYAGRMDKIGKGIWMGDFNTPGDIELFPMSEREAFDIDYGWQFELAEALYSNKNKR